MNTTTALLWIPPGICKEHPVQVEYTEEEYQRISKLTGLRLEESKLAYSQLTSDLDIETKKKELNTSTSIQKKSSKKKTIELEKNKENKPLPSPFFKSSPSPSSDMEEEDNDDDEVMENEIRKQFDQDVEMEPPESKAIHDEGLEIYHFSDYEEDPDSALQSVNLFGNLTSLVEESNLNGDDDPYLQFNSGSDSEKEEDDLHIDPTDHMLCLTTHQDGLSVLEFQIFTSQHTLYPHHDILLPTFPLCLARSPKQLGNWLAVGTMHPEIEIWDIDQLDPLVPIAMLGGQSNPMDVSSSITSTTQNKDLFNSKKTKKKLKLKSNPTTSFPPHSHSDSVLTLAWNEQHGILASGSADHTLKLWDPYSQFQFKRSFQFQGKVSMAVWASTSDLLIGSLNRQCTYLDTRTPHSPFFINLPCDPEHLALQDHEVYLSLENGSVFTYDLRQWSSSSSSASNGFTSPVPLWQLQAHSTACTCVAPSAFGLATIGDTHVKLWQSGSTPSLIQVKDLSLGALFTCAWCPGYPGFLAVGGEKGSVIVDFNTNRLIDTHDDKFESDDDEEDGIGSD